MARRTPLLAALAAALVLASCGGDDSGQTVTVTQQAAPPQQQSQAKQPDVTGSGEPKIPITGPDDQQPTTTPTPPPSNGGSLAAAQATVRRQGYVVNDPSAYHQGQTLRVLIGTKAGSGDGYAKRAFFFVGGRYIGTDTSDDSAGIRVNAQEDSKITLEYATYGRQAPLCCPTGSASVRYGWNGARLTPLDPIPTSGSGSNSRL